MTRRSTINNITKFVFTLLGLWPGTSYVLVRVYWFVSLTTDEVWHYRFFRSHLQPENLPILVDCLSSFLAHVKMLTKLFVFWFNQQKFVQILAMMTEDWSECADRDDEMREIVSKAKLSDRITVAIFALHLLTIVIYCIGVFASIEFDVSGGQSELRFLMNIELPVRISTISTYRLLLSAQFVQLVILAIGTGLVNALLLTLVLHVGGQIDVLTSWLAGLVVKEDDGSREAVVVMMSKIIRKHQRIIQFSTCIENLYTYITLVLFASNTMMICMLAFLVVTSLDSPNAAEQITRSFLFYVITNLESFIFCYAGEYLRNKSDTIGTAAYNSTWYNLRPKSSRVLLLVILRAQKQLTLTAGRMTDLSLESFANVMKASVSYMSVLLAIQ